MLVTLVSKGLKHNRTHVFPPRGAPFEVVHHQVVDETALLIGVMLDLAKRVAAIKRERNIKKWLPYLIKVD